ncbi:low temperature requirement protein A [Salinibacterium soli]|uniref:Low temperature requirement protein A n=1 Tax=Antiquaquibacter soli TaxID=3064523 RepID=A0ABT9BPI6_9MICO|nr:low temperature requirement protein A [Protaetiibacter sp. WY-16]MDO7882947.1 low temperature requirement protein A [Protaetiibacter sp. WY-16]
MIAGRTLRGIAPAGDGHRVTQFELFFDLVFVFAFTRVTELMLHERGVWGVAHGLTVLGILWLSWSTYTWLANQVRMDRGVMRLGLAVATAAVFVVAVSIPDAFGAEVAPRVLLVSAYLVVRLVHVVLFMLAAHGQPELRRQVLRTNAASLPPAFVLLFAGAVLGGTAQSWLWIAAWVVDAALIILSSRRGGAWRLGSAVHWAERYSLIVILAIGESIISIGAGLREAGPAGLVAALVAIGGAVLVWWLYFDGFVPGVERVLASRDGARRVRLGNLAYTDLHLPIVAGIVLIALGIEIVLGHITEHEPLGLRGAAALWGGLAVFLTATVVIWRIATGRWLLARVLTVATVVPVVVLCAGQPPVVTLALAVGLGVLIVAVEALVPSIGPRESSKSS